MDQELTFLKKSIDRRAHDHSSFFLLVTNRVVLTEKKAQKVFRQRLLSVRILMIRLTHVYSILIPDFFNTVVGTEFNNDIIDF